METYRNMDLDYYGISLNCLQVPLGKLLKRGFATGHGTLRQPNSINAAAALAAIILQSNQNEMFGGQAFPTFDWELAPYVAKSFISNCLKAYKLYLETYGTGGPGDKERIFGEVSNAKNELEELYEKNGTIIDLEHEVSCITSSDAYRAALEWTERDTFQAMEGFCHNMNTMQSRAGSQTVFSSINYGMCTLPEARMLIKCLLETTMNGLGHHETQIFPIQIFKCKKGINQEPGEPNYDLFQLAIKCSAKRLFPNFNNQDAPYNLQYWDPKRPETEVATMGCAAPFEAITISVNGECLEDIAIADAFEFLKNKFEKKYSNDVSEYIILDDVKILDKQGWVDCLGILKNNSVTNWVRVWTENRCLTLTDDHPLRIIRAGKSQRIFVKDLVLGDKIILQNGDEEYVDSLENLHQTMDSFDVETESDTFILSGVWSHNCRTRVMANEYDKEHAQATGRGNFSFTTINLPHIALQARQKYPNDRGAMLDEFWNLYDELIDASIQSLEDRFELISHRHLYNYPFLMGEGLYLDSEKYKPEDEIGEILKQSTLSVGFCGLAECLVALFDKHHGESKYCQVFGLQVVSYLRHRMDKKCKETGLSWSCFATPAESTCFTFLRKDRKKFGIVKGVTDREYYTNSSHVPVYYPISAVKKIDIEAPYHELCNAGHIGYVELSGDATKNPKAYEQIVKYAMHAGMTYFSINTQNDRCPICGYVGIINDSCPCCGFKEGEGVSIEHLKACGCWDKVRKSFDVVE